MAMTEIERNTRLDELNEVSRLICMLNDNPALKDHERWKEFQRGIALRGMVLLLGALSDESTQDEGN